MSRLSDPRPRFTEDLYEPWCRLWRRVWEGCGGLAAWQVRTLKPEVDRAIAETESLPLSALTALLGRVRKRAPGEADLVRCWTWVRRLEQLHMADPARMLAPLTRVRVAGKTHVLIPPPRLYALPIDESRFFALDAEMGEPRQLDLHYHWQLLPGSKTLETRQVPSLERKRLQGTLRVGMAPFAAMGDLDWHFDADDARGVKGGVPVQCRGSKDPRSHGWLLTPICLDYACADSLFGALGGDLYLVPAMTGGLSSFEDKARRLGRSHRAASFVCNAQTAGERRCLGYLPVRDEGARPSQVGDLPLFILDAEIGV